MPEISGEVSADGASFTETVEKRITGLVERVVGD
jgi:hypothetical protein